MRAFLKVLQEKSPQSSCRESAPNVSLSVSPSYMFLPLISHSSPFNLSRQYQSEVPGSCLCCYCLYNAEGRLNKHLNTHQCAVMTD